MYFKLPIINFCKNELSSLDYIDLILCPLCTMEYIKLRRIGVPTRGSSSRRIPMLCNLSQVKVKSWVIKSSVQNEPINALKVPLETTKVLFEKYVTFRSSSSFSNLFIDNWILLLKLNHWFGIFFNSKAIIHWHTGHIPPSIKD